MPRPTSVLTLSALAAAASLFAGAPIANAAMLYSGGDVRNLWTYNMYIASNSFDRAYSNVAVPAGQTWTITGLEAFVADPDPNFSNAHAPQALLDIRTGMSSTSLGTQLTSATLSDTTYVSQGYQSFGWTVYDWTINLATPLTLTGGQTYFIAVTPNHPDGYNAGMMWANGTNAVGGPTDNSSIWWENNFSYGTVIRTEPGDYALRLFGPPVPEPTTAALLAPLAATPLLRRRRPTA